MKGARQEGDIAPLPRFREVARGARGLFGECSLRSHRNGVAGYNGSGDGDGGADVPRQSEWIQSEGRKIWWKLE